MFKKLFTVNTEPRPWHKVLLWWELRRVIYNVFLVLSGILSLFILSLIIQDLGSFFSPPLFLFIGIIAFVVVANICYTAGWIFQLITIKSNNKFINKIKPKLFVIGLLFSFVIVLMPCIIAGSYTIITGNRIKSAYADFTTTQPKVIDIVGEYRLTDETKKQFHVPDSIASKTFLKLNTDMTFEMVYFPHYTYGMNGEDVEEINAKGKWKTELDQGSWVLPIDYDTLTNAETGMGIKGSYYDANSFHLNGDKPPYEIYIIIGDPDSWEGIRLKKK